MKKLVILLILLMAAACYSKDLSLSADVSTFYPVGYDSIANADSLIFMEIYYEMNRSKLNFDFINDQWQSEFSVLFELRDTEGQIVESLKYESGITLSNQEQTSINYFVFDKLPFVVSPGDYVVKLRICEEQDQCDSVVRQYSFNSYSNSHLQISDITLLSSISADSSTSKFTKYGRRLLPNPSNTVGTERTLLYFYAEVYNLSSNPQDSANIFVKQYLIEDNNGKVLRIYPQMKVKKPGITSVIIDGIESSQFNNGNYRLGLKVYDPANSQEAIKYKEFRVTKQQVLTDDPAVKYELEQFANMLNFIGSRKEQTLYSELTDPGKLNFMERFWEERDSIPETLENEYKDNFFKRWNYAQATFADSKDDILEGWETDRGRVFITYGSPDNVERHSISIYGNEWEKWEYFEIQGGVYFIFADLLGLGQLQLLHSTAEGEKYNPNWQYQITNEPIGIMQELDEHIVK